MTLPTIKEVTSLLSFMKKSLTKGGFRLTSCYISGLISSAKKTVKKIAQASKEINHQSALNRILTEAKFEKEQIEQRYLRKARFLFKGTDIYLIIDDTLVYRDGKRVEEAQSHFDHNENKHMRGHQFFTALLYTSFMQFPIFPKLYSKNTDSKIGMGRSLIDSLSESKINIHTILFDSWYADEELMKKCIGNKTRIVGAIKSNRKIMFHKKRKWRSLSYVSEYINSQKTVIMELENHRYKIFSNKAKLHHLPMMKLIISQELDENDKTVGKAHLVSSNPNDTPENIILTYKIRWKIETFHRDIKQNLGFAQAFFRRREGIIRHTILATIAYAILTLFMFRTGRDKTIGECCEYLRDKSKKEVVGKIVQIRKKEERVQRFLDEFI